MRFGTGVPVSVLLEGFETLPESSFFDVYRYNSFVPVLRSKRWFKSLTPSRLECVGVTSLPSCPLFSPLLRPQEGRESGWCGSVTGRVETGGVPGQAGPVPFTAGSGSFTPDTDLHRHPRTTCRSQSGVRTLTSSLRPQFDDCHSGRRP